MRTIRIEKIDGFDVVVGHGKILIDKAATLREIDRQAKETDEYKALEAHKERLRSTRGNFKSDNDLIKLANKLRNKMHQLSESCIVYFELSKDELEVSEDEYNNYKKLAEKARKQHSVVTKDKKIIKDLRGLKYYLEDESNIKELVINKLGVDIPDNAILSLDPKQLNKFTNGEAKVSEMNAAAILAIKLRSKLEIQGKGYDEALSESQSWYQEEVAKIEAKYA